MSPQREQEPISGHHLGSTQSFERQQSRQSKHEDYGKTSGLLALSAEDKARIGNLIKVLAKERRDKEDLREKLGQQASRLQDLEREREVSQQKEAELVARVTRSVDLLRTYQLEASSRKQGTNESCEEAEIVRLSPELPPLPQLHLWRPQVEEPEEAKESADPSNDLRSADPVPSEAVESARQPASFEKVFALKPPQLSVLQRYLSIQDSPTQCHSERQNTAVQTAPLDRAARSVSMSPKRPKMNGSFVSPGKRPKAKHEEERCREDQRLSQGSHGDERLDQRDHSLVQGCQGYQGYQRLRLGRRHCRWAQSKAQVPAKVSGAKLDASHSPARSRQSSEMGARVRNASADSRLMRTLDVPSEPLLGSPLARSSVRQSMRKSPGISLESLNHWPAPLRLESCYAPNMFDVIDSLESGSRVESMHEKVSKPSSISEELRRLQRELVSIQHKISQGPSWGSVLDDTVRTQAWNEDSPPEREVAPAFCQEPNAFPSLGHWKPLETEESQELSQEIDDVLTLLQSVKSKDERKETCEFL